MKEPEKYLKELGIEVPCAVQSPRLAVLSPAYRLYVNHEIYFFSDSAALLKFERDPLRYCGWVTDPVTRARFQPTLSSPRFEHRGRPYYFRSDSSLAIFKAHPDSLADREGF